jgi:hypothetical protein
MMPGVLAIDENQALEVSAALVVHRYLE